MNSHHAHFIAFGLALILAPTAFAKKKQEMDFSPFKGNYTGSCMVTQGATLNLPGTVNVTIAVPKKGNTAVVTYNAAIPFGTETFLFTTTLFLKRKGQVSASDVFAGVGSSPSTGTGKYYVKKKTFTFSASRPYTGDALFQLDGTAAVKDVGKTRNLTLVLVVRSNELTFTNTLLGRVPKGPKDDK